MLAVIPAMITRPERERAKQRRLVAMSASVVAMMGAIAVIVWKMDAHRQLGSLMYEAFFGLSERPFDLTPNPRYLVLTDAHREALSNLEYAIASQKGRHPVAGRRRHRQDHGHSNRDRTPARAGALRTSAEPGPGSSRVRRDAGNTVWVEPAGG